MLPQPRLKCRSTYLILAGSSARSPRAFLAATLARSSASLPPSCAIDGGIATTDCMALMIRGSRESAVGPALSPVALAVDAVAGIRPLAAERLHELPPLLRDADTAIVSAIGALDAELFLVLQASRLVPEALVEGERGERLAS